MGRQKKYAPALLAFAALFLVGCGFPPSRVEFIQTLAADNRKIGRSTRSFNKALSPLKDGKPADPTQVRSAYQEMEKALKEVRADADGQLLPPMSNSAKDFLTAYKTYLDGQQEILTTIMLPIVQKIEQPADENGAPSLADRTAFVNDQLAKVTAKEKETWGPLISAQSTYASEHNYQVQGLAAYIEFLKSGK